MIARTVAVLLLLGRIAASSQSKDEDILFSDFDVVQAAGRKECLFLGTSPSQTIPETGSGTSGERLADFASPVRFPHFRIGDVTAGAEIPAGLYGRQWN